jgi:hypothetical protein
MAWTQFEHPAIGTEGLVTTAKEVIEVGKIAERRVVLRGQS